jgi:hypothetical protein
MEADELRRCLDQEVATWCRRSYSTLRKDLEKLVTYSLWSCAGCKQATLEVQGASEDSDSEWAEASGEYYPRRLEDSIQPQFFKNLNNELGRLYKEIVTCFNEDCLLLCTIGLRALIEGVCNDKGFKDRKLENNIEGLTKLLPSPNMIEALHALRLFGNDAAHRLEARGCLKKKGKLRLSRLGGMHSRQ